MNLNILKTSALALIIGFVSSCKSDDEGTSVGEDAALAESVITNNTNNVIVTTYNELNSKSAALVTAVTALQSNTTDANLTAAKEAWQATRAPWESSEGFLYGPVDTGGIDPAMDTWPVDVEAMDNILNSDVSITPELLAQNDEARGFHLIEYLLWGINGNATASDLSARELEYLVAAAQDLNNNTGLLYVGWETGNSLTNGVAYKTYFLTAGEDGNEKYTSKKNAVLEFVNGMITIAEEVGTGKIADPLNEGGEAQPQKEESRFSHNSKVDFANNIRSIQNIYLGTYGSVDGRGVSDIVAEDNTALDTQTKTLITESIAAIEAIPGTFTDAIVNNRDAVITAQNKVVELQNHLDANVKTYISGLTTLD